MRVNRASRHRLWIIFYVYSCSPNTCFHARSVSAAARPDSKLLFTSLYTAVNTRLYIGASDSQLTLSCFLLRVHPSLMAFSFGSIQSIRTCCRFAADTFLFLTLASLIILHSNKLQNKRSELVAKHRHVSKKMIFNTLSVHVTGWR